MSSKLDSAQISLLGVILNCVKNLRVEEERNGTKKKIVWFKQTFLITKQNKTKAKKKKKRGDFDWHFLLKCVNKNY